MLTNEQAHESAMVAFLRQELIRYNELLLKVNTSLDSLFSAVKGESVMSETLEATYNSILQNDVPMEWNVSVVFMFYALNGQLLDCLDVVECRI